MSDPDFVFLISRHFNGTLSRDEAVILSGWVKQKPGNADQFVQAGLLHSHLRDLLSSSRILEDQQLSHDPLADAAIMPAIRLEDEVEPVSAVPAPLSAPAPNPVRTQRSRWLNWRGAAVLFVAAGLAIAVISKWLQGGPKATVAATIDAVWDGDLKLVVGNKVPPGPLYLKSGFAELQLDRGASLLVEAPAHLQILSDNSVALNDGKVFAQVPQSAHGFVLETFTARIVDLGTEFGASATNGGATEVDIFKGTVQVAARDANTSTVPLSLEGGQAATISSGLCTPLPNGARPQNFVRSLAPVAEPLDVVDLICGGDGTTHRSAVAINPSNGRIGTVQVINRGVFPSIFHRVAAIPVVDGVFVPNGTTAVSSDGVLFAFPKTSGEYAEDIWTGPQRTDANRSLRFGGIDYISNSHQVLTMHSNKGLTIDLQAVRRLHPGMNLTEFTSIAGNSVPPLVQNSDTGNTRADLYVIVDGVSRFQQIKFSPTEGPFDVNVPLGVSDRFLSLVVTDGGDDVKFDWVAFADPRLK